MLSLDRKILESGSAVQRRLIFLAEAAGEITVFVLAALDSECRVSERLAVYGFGGPRAIQLWKMWRRGKSLILNPSSLTRGEKAAYDLITVQDPYFLGFLGQQLSARFGVPLEIQIHGLEKFNGIRKRIAEFVLRRADKIRVVSERLKRELYSIFRIPYSKMYVLPVYTQVESLIHNPLSLAADKRPFTFLTIGRLVPVKNIGLQIRTFTRIAKEYPQARLRIVGDGPETLSLKLYAQRHALNASVIFEGEQKGTEQFYKEADAFLLTSDYEGWGLVITEAAAYGLPIIMTDVGLAGEFIRNNENGLVIPVRDEDALVAAMRRVITDTELRARLSKAACASFLALPSAGEQIKKQIEEWRCVFHSGITV